MLARPGDGSGVGGGGGTRKPEPVAPTFRVPGASVAARAAAASASVGGAATTGGAPKPGPSPVTMPAGVAPPSTGATGSAGGTATDDGMDDEGFQQVRPRAWRKGRGAAALGKPTGGDGACGAGEGGDRDGDAREGPNDGGEDEGCAQGPTPGELHRAWQDEVAVVRHLKSQGLAPEHPAMRAAGEARDAAERAWRGAKDPAPASVRLARAQAKFDRALELQGESHRALCEYEAQHKERLAVLRAKLEEDRDRVRARREQLEAVQAEVGAGAKGAQGTTEQGAAAREVHTAICQTVAPTIAALVEQLDTSTPAWSALNGLLGTLSTSTAVLEKAFAPQRPAQVFRISDATDTAMAGTGSGGDDDAWSEWSESHELHADDDADDQGDGGATRSNTTGDTGGGAGGDCDMGTGEWWGGHGAGWEGATRWQECGYGKWARSGDSWADSWEQEHGGPTADPRQPPAARRRLEPAPPTPQAMGSAGGSAIAVDEAALIEQRKRQHNERVQHIVLAAIDAGIQPITAAGDELCMLDPHQLDAWVAENFPAGVPQK